MAFGAQPPQSGSSLTFESIQIAWRFFVMIWFEATQSDQPEITWMSSLTGLPFGSMSVLPLYVNPLSVSIFFAAAGSYFAAAVAATFCAPLTHDGKMPFRPIASVGG